MSRLEFSGPPERLDSEFDAYRTRLRRIAGLTHAPAAPTRPILPSALLTVIAALAVVAALAVSLAIWRIYNFPH
ncbi:MAG: hypothetical protein ACR652_19395 [Methylocystis sp.]|uniref:hypothetical protein n=1 Tax=Methylocystis sp. TaxID=1911079 RepID=UPI003DA23639